MTVQPAATTTPITEKSGDHSTSSALLSWSKSDLSLMFMMDGTTDDLSETLSGYHPDDPRVLSTQHTTSSSKSNSKSKMQEEARRKMQLHREEDDDLSVYSHLSNSGKNKANGNRLQENQKWHYFVEFLLVALGLSVTVATWIALAKAQETQQHQQFVLTATQIQDGVQDRSHRLREALQVQSQTLTDLSRAAQVEWPYYIPTSGSFRRQAQHVREEGRLQVLALAPLVQASERDVWNRFVQFHHGRRNDTAMPVYYYDNGKPTPFQDQPPQALEQEEQSQDLVLEQEETAVSKAVLADEHSNQTAPPSTLHAPLWLMSPAPVEPAVYNYDILSSNDAQQLLQAMEQAPQGQAVISKILDFSHLSRQAYQLDNGTQSSVYPHSLTFQPVYEQAISTSNSNQPVAILFGIMYWHSYINNLLPSETKGIMAEFQNNCGQSIRYRLDGDTIIFVGQGDASKTTFTDFDKTGYPYYSISFFHPPEPPSSNNINDCQYTLYVYPTDEFFQDSSSNQAVVYTVVFAVLFVVTAILVLYAIRRMDKGKNEALNYAFEANNIIASMFPNSSFSFGLGQHDHAGASSSWFGNWGGATSAKQKELDMEEFGGLCGMNISNHSRRAPIGGRRRTKKQANHIQEEPSEQRRTSYDERVVQFEASCASLDCGDFSGNKSIASSKATLSSSRTRKKHNKLKARQKLQANKGDQAWDDTPLGSRPIADLFPEATVLFADIVGFTAWSSSREPHHVFELLESIYHTFDDIARKRCVFKVDTVGDCYCCVTGVPLPRDDHAVIMAEFAREILVAFDVVTSTLEVQLGPETGDLCMRVGVHSGPVTAGVLRGDRSRFQIFGSTVSRTAKIEAEGEPGRIVISKETADLLAADGKSAWFLNRDNSLEGGGTTLYTYWLDPRKEDCEALDLKRTGAHPALLRAANLIQKMDENCLIKTVHQRQVDWIVDQMEKLLKQVIVQRRQLEEAVEKKPGKDGPVIIPQAAIAQSEVCVFDEVREVIPMPTFDAMTALEIKEADDIELSPDVLWQLHDFVTSISTMYRANPFHNFEHASHVTMSVVKLLSRVVCPTDYSAHDADNSKTAPGMLRSSKSKNKLELHDFSYGISSDPLTQFAVVFGALIHDVDHVGVSNAQLVKEGSRLARIYKSQSVAEQNSVNIAWDLLMDPAFEALRRCIYTNSHEFDRFRATVVNVVMATDIVDKDLKNLRNARWEKAFSKQEGEEYTKEDNDRKATIVLEHLIQASDISHTMQHWHVYQKWNHKLFRELYIAHIKGRMGGNPADFWYKGEIGFFDFYIIPLAKKLRDCGVFGVSCDEFLNYALENRAQWEKDGADVVKKLIHQVENDKDIIALKLKYNFVEQPKD